MKERDNQTFDMIASHYDAALERGIAISGENKNYFAQGRVRWLRDCLAKLSTTPRRIMDFGCGTGTSTPFLLELPSVEYFLGTDQSHKSLEIARQAYGSERTQFLSLDAYQPSGQFDLVFCNGVFHHIPPAKRPAAIRYVHRSLRPGGLFAVWENNPWNPGTFYVMSRIPFDRDAVTLNPRQARRLLREKGFEILSTDFLFIFPGFLRWCRRIEPFCSRLPLGAQYQVLCRKPLSKMEKAEEALPNGS